MMDAYRVFHVLNAYEDDTKIVIDVATDGSRFVVLDATAPESKPGASVALPQRVPLGFHGNWISA